MARPALPPPRAVEVPRPWKNQTFTSKGSRRRGDRLLGLEERPVGGQEAGVLVRVGVADHHLEAATAAHVREKQRVVEQAGHRRGAAFEIGQRLEQRHDVERQRRARTVEPDLARQHHHLQQIRRRVGHADDVGAARAPDPQRAQRHLQGAGGRPWPIGASGRAEASSRVSSASRASRSSAS